MDVCEEVVIRPIEPEDDPVIAQVILDTTLEWGVCGPGTARSDPEVHAMHRAYTRERSLYLVAELGGEVRGGAGIGCLEGGDEATCELRKMYLRPELRSKGVGRELLERLLEAAKELDYRQCYLETMSHMSDARRLYVAAGFVDCERMGDTGHFTCNSSMVKEL